MKTRFFPYILFILICTACNFTGQDKIVELALLTAGDNRSELEKVLNHYAHDTLKLAAARFLIANMPEHYSYSDTIIVSAYYNGLDSIIRQMKDASPIEINQAIEKYAHERQASKFPKCRDTQIISANFLIDNIDRAFEQWNESPWCQHLTFDDFCEFILPYKSSELQALDNWRSVFSNMYVDSISQLISCASYANSAYMAAETFNNCLINNYNLVSSNTSKPFMPYKTRIQLSLPYGTCADYCQAGIPLFRSVGIPIVRDNVPQWGYCNVGHSWVVTKNKDGIEIPFVPFYDNLTERHKVDEVKGKVYRQTFAANKMLQELNQSGEWVPDLFKNIFQKDVTALYTSTSTIDFQADGEAKYAFLAVSNSMDWNPIAVTKVRNRHFIFDNVGRGCVYILICFDINGKISYLSNPFMVNWNGNISYIGESQEKETVTLYRKHPLLEYAWKVARHIIGAKIETDNNPNFDNPIIARCITEPANRAGIITIDPDFGPYRYWRLIKRDSVARLDVAELSFFNKKSSDKVCGKVIESAYQSLWNMKYGQYAFDNNNLIAFTATSPNEVWVGLDMGKPTEISRIEYTPRGDGNTIEPGDEYELFYWKDNQWASLGRKKAQTVNISFENVPKGALFYLRDHSKGKEERIFTIDKNGNQVWW